jgi:hypothetical protein
MSLRQQGNKLESPFPFPKGKAGAGGFPPRRQTTAAPPARGQAPLRDPPKPGRSQILWLTGAGLLMEAARASKRFPHTKEITPTGD